MQENTSLVGQHVEVKGWVRTVRAQKTFTFLEVNDGSSVGGLQVILHTDAEGHKFVDDGLITTGCSVAASGELVESPGGKQALELKASSLELIGMALDSVLLACVGNSQHISVSGTWNSRFSHTLL